MFSRMTFNGRTWILLFAWLLFAAISCADVFDLSDDLKFFATSDQALVDDNSEESSEAALTAHAASPISFQLIFTEFRYLPSIRIDVTAMPLYERLSVLRI